LNQDVIHKNWFQRHWEWLVPTIVFCGVLPYYSMLYTNPSALHKVRAHKEASEFLGGPIETLFLVEGEVCYHTDENSVRMTIPIKGKTVKARMDIKAHNVNEESMHNVIAMRTKNLKNKLQL